MPKITDEPLKLYQVRLYTKDLEVLQRQFSGHIGVNKVIRSIVRAYVKQVEAKANNAIDIAETFPEETE